MKTNGPGVYDDVCTVARDATGAVLCILIVLGGKHGGGFSAQALDPALLKAVPALLRDLADKIAAENRQNATDEE